VTRRPTSFSVLGVTLVLMGLAATAAARDVAVLLEGPVVEGVFDRNARTFLSGERRIGVLALLLVEREDGSFLWAEDEDARWRGYHRLVHERRRDELVDLAKEAVRARDHVTARRLYNWAKKEGLEGREERIVRKRIERLEERPRRVNRKRIEPVLEREKVLRRQLPELLVDRTRRALAEDRALGLRFLRRTLDEFPDAPGALELLAKIRPDDARIEDPRAWLDWHLDLERRGFTFTPEDAYALKRERHRWRPDLRGVQNDRVRLFTPHERMDLVGDCLLRLAYTEAALAELFATEEPVERTREPLTVHLYAHRDNFVRHVGYEEPAELPPWYRWKYGQEDFREDVVRVYAPDGVAVGYERLTYALVHEAAGLWIKSRCPRFATTKLYQGRAASGYAVASGLRGLLAQAPLDRERGRLDLAARGTDALPFVVKHRERLVPWAELFLMDSNDVAKMVNSDPELGNPRRSAPLRGTVFHHQAIALCHYLYNAGDGRLREAFARYVADHYRGEQPRMNPDLAFGASAEQIGAAVLAHAARR